MEEMNMFDDNRLIHYEGELGVFDYDPEEFEIIKLHEKECLHYCGNGKSINLPEGCTNTRYMFYERSLPEGFSLGNKFDTSNVRSMSSMFMQCKMPEGFL